MKMPDPEKLMTLEQLRKACSDAPRGVPLLVAEAIWRGNPRPEDRTPKLSVLVRSGIETTWGTTVSGIVFEDRSIAITSTPTRDFLFRVLEPPIQACLDR